jgi:hypothetical protein
MYHIYIYINIPLSLFHLITTTTTTILYYITTTEKKKKIFFDKSWIKLLKYYHISSLSIIKILIFLLLLSNIYLLLPITPLLSITITATTTSTSITWNQISLMTLRWIIPWIFNISVNLLNKVYLNLSLWQSPSLYYCQSQCQSQLLSKSLLSSEDESEP